MTDTMKALARLTEWPGLLDDGRPDDERVECHLLAGDLRVLHSLLPTLRAALAPAADDEVEAIRARNDAWDYALHWNSDEGDEVAAKQLDQPRTRPDMTDFQVANWVFLCDRGDFRLIAAQTLAKERIRWLSAQLAKSQVDTTRLLRHVARLAAELEAERGRRVEVEKRFEADMFWDYYDPEQPYYSVEELIQEREYEGEGIVQVQEAIRCPDAAYIYRITNDPETDDREIVLERLSDADHVHYRAAMAVASGAREMWGVMVDRLAAQLFGENPAPVPERMHTCQWKNLDWHYRKHHRSLAHDRLAATLTKDTP